MTIGTYDITQPSMRKAWKVEFEQFLIEYYRPSVVNADKVFKAVPNVDNFIKGHTSLNTKMFLVKDIETIQQLRKQMLSHQASAFGPVISANDYKVIVLERYIEFLQSRSDDSSCQETESLSHPPKPTATSKQSEEEMQTATEGLVSEVRYFRNKRNRAIRNQCAERDHYTCQVCGFNFEKVYGERGKGFIEIHHKNPLSSYDGEHEVKLEELVALCSNCHSMVHYGGRLLDVDDLRKSISNQE